MRDVTETRRRRDDVETLGKRLAVNASALDFKKFAYRFINDAPRDCFRRPNKTIGIW